MIQALMLAFINAKCSLLSCIRRRLRHQRLEVSKVVLGRQPTYRPSAYLAHISEEMIDFGRSK
jgi:hypothetical protein